MSQVAQTCPDAIQLMNCTKAKYAPAGTAASCNLRTQIQFGRQRLGDVSRTVQAMARFCTVTLRSWLVYCISRYTKHSSVLFAPVSHTILVFGLVEIERSLSGDQYLGSVGSVRLRTVMVNRSRIYELV